MKVSYGTTAPLSRYPELDATVHEIDAIAQQHPGPVTRLYPWGQYRRWLPTNWLRRVTLNRLRELDRDVALHHISSDRLQLPRSIYGLERPLLLRLHTADPNHVVAPDTRSKRVLIVTESADFKDALLDTGWPRVENIPAGIDYEAFCRLPPAPTRGPFTLLMASAPWTKRQLQTKHVDSLLRAVAELEDVRLTLLWRGVARNALDRLVKRLRIEDRVKVVNGPTDAAEHMARAHACVLAVRRPRLVKAMPHSLLESLAAGRPVITSSNLAISQLVRSQRLGSVVDGRSPNLAQAIVALRQDYDETRERCVALETTAFDRKRTAAAFTSIYERLSSA